MALTCYAYFMQTERQFYILAAVVGTVQGGVQALSRSYFARLIPRERAGEYFGFYNMLAKFAAVLGPLAMGVVAIATGNQRLSILVLDAVFHRRCAAAGARARPGRGALTARGVPGAACARAATLGRSRRTARRNCSSSRRRATARSAAVRNGAPVRRARPTGPGCARPTRSAYAIGPS